MMLCSLAAFVVVGTLNAQKGNDPTDLFPGKDILPILAWYSIPPSDLTLERFKELSAAGFNINFSHITKYEDAVKVLELCRQAGIKSMFSCAELHDKPEETVKSVRKHPAFAGYFLRDEPSIPAFKELGECDYDCMGCPHLDVYCEGDELEDEELFHELYDDDDDW